MIDFNLLVEDDVRRNLNDRLIVTV